jgi:hypothetical protein
VMETIVWKEMQRIETFRHKQMMLGELTQTGPEDAGDSCREQKYKAQHVWMECSSSH